MHGDREEDLEGEEIAAEWTFSSLQKFGQVFMNKLRGKKMPNKLLEKVKSFPLFCGWLEKFFLESKYISQKVDNLGFQKKKKKVPCRRALTVCQRCLNNVDVSSPVAC